MATKRVQLTITDQRFFDDAQNKREAVRVWSAPFKLPQYIESWDSQNEQGKVWVKVPKIPANGSVDLYMYYGNPSAVSESDGESVFEFFDDFEGDSIDTSKWNTGGVVSVSNSEVLVHGDGSYGGTIYGKEEVFNPPIIVEGRVRYAGSFSLTSGWVGFKKLDGSFLYEIGTWWDKSYICYVKTGTISQSSVPESETRNYDVYKFVWRTDKVSYYKGDTLLGEYTSGLDSSQMAVLGIATEKKTDTATYMDWVRVRKYAEQEPTVVVGEEEASDVSGWLYRRKITITNPNSYDLEHFQVAIDLDGSNFDFTKANADGSDIRVAYALARYSLPYYIETWDTSTPQAVIWVGIDSETKFYIELNPANTTDDSDESVMNLDEATNYSLSKFEKYA